MSQPNAQEMLAGMLNKELYVALRQPADISRMAELLSAHLQWAIAAEGRGELFASGPFAKASSPPGSAGGMSILRAESVDHAMKLLEKDPFIAQGVFTVDVRKWVVMEGAVTLSVRFSDQSSRLL